MLKDVDIIIRICWTRFTWVGYMLTHTTKFALHVSRVDTEAVASYSVKQHMLTQAKKTNVSVFCIDAFWTGMF